MTNPDGQVELGEDAAWVAAALVLVAVLAGAVVLAEWPLWGTGGDAPGAPELVEPGENGTELWPYTARSRTFGSRTLGVNMVFFGDSEEVRTALTQRSDLEWQVENDTQDELDDGEAAPEEGVVINRSASNISDVVDWRRAEGSTRYTYFEIAGQSQWTDESYQLHAGTYFGSRQHIRAYDDPRGEWTAIQIHGEHWDWFRLRHTVTGISDTQRALEREFVGEPYVDDVVRMPFDNGTADGDGWATGVYLAGVFVPFLVGVAARTRRLRREAERFARRRSDELALGAGLFALYTGIRYAGIAAESLFVDLSPKVIAGALYLVLVVGTPAVAYLLGEETDDTWGFAFAALGLGTAFVVDFAAMGVSVISLRVVLHRSAVLLAIGLVAIGGARSAEDGERPPPLFVGLAGWLLALVAALFGFV